MTGTAYANSPKSSPSLDAHGRYHDRGKVSVGVVAVYAVLLLIVVLVFRSPNVTTEGWVPYFLLALGIFFFVRYLWTRYWIDDTHLVAWRLLGGARLRLADIRKIEFAALRDLSPTGFFGAWGWRGRMWSPLVGKFDSIHTEPIGILVTGEPVPMFISPRDPPAFARELSRRVRSYSGRLSVDAGDPAGSPGASDV